MAVTDSKSLMTIIVADSPHNNNNIGKVLHLETKYAKAHLQASVISKFSRGYTPDPH
jgi:hypothetical protein